MKLFILSMFVVFSSPSFANEEHMGCLGQTVVEVLTGDKVEAKILSLLVRQGKGDETAVEPFEKIHEAAEQIALAVCEK